MPPNAPTPAGWRVLDRPAWQAARAEHEQRVDALLAGHLARAARGERHPVEDFLFSYYSYRPAQLRRFAPGIGVAIAAPDDVPALRDHGRFELPGHGEVLALDVPAFVRRRGAAVQHIRSLLVATASRPPTLTCFGLHEWAMVYRLPGTDVRHPAWPLRLGASGTDAVVEAHRLRCSHIDAVRFFTPAATGRNELRPTRDTQVALEQPGCLHATMDLYKWAFKLAPATPSALVLDCFELARDARGLDMRASPYDLRALGHSPVPIETAQGKAEYVAGQRGFAERAAPLRATLIEICDQVLALTP